MFEKLKSIVGEDYIKKNESMAKHCTFRCGGEAEIYVVPGSVEEVVQVIKTCREQGYPYMVLGDGSYVLVRDEGYHGAVIEINNRISTIDVVGEEIIADAGAKLSAVAMAAYENDLAGFELQIGSAGEIGEIMQIFMQKRKMKQPLEYPSAGSTFKRPTGYYAGKLIEDAGLRGYRVGGAMVSEKHCGFVINYDNATATEVLQLIEDVKARVKEQSGVELEPEVRII